MVCVRVCVNMVDMGKEEPPTLTGWCEWWWPDTEASTRKQIMHTKAQSQKELDASARPEQQIYLYFFTFLIHEGSTVSLLCLPRGTNHLNMTLVFLQKLTWLGTFAHHWLIHSPLPFLQSEFTVKRFFMSWETSDFFFFFSVTVRGEVDFICHAQTSLPVKLPVPNWATGLLLHPLKPVYPVWFLCWASDLFIVTCLNILGVETTLRESRCENWALIYVLRVETWQVFHKFQSNEGPPSSCLNVFLTMTVFDVDLLQGCSFCVFFFTSSLLCFLWSNCENRMEATDVKQSHMLAENQTERVVFFLLILFRNRLLLS